MYILYYYQSDHVILLKLDTTELGITRAYRS